MVFTVCILSTIPVSFNWELKVKNLELKVTIRTATVVC